MLASNINSLISVLQVANQAKALAWYAKLFGREADIIPIDGVAEWRLTDNAWIQVTHDPDKAEGIGMSSIIIGVNNLKKQADLCDEAKIQRSAIIEYLGIIKMFELLDPDGNKISFVEDISNQL